MSRQQQLQGAIEVRQGLRLHDHGFGARRWWERKIVRGVSCRWRLCAVRLTFSATPTSHVFERAPIAKGAAFVVRTNERFLGSIRCILSIAEDTETHPVDHHSMAADDLGEGSPISALRLRHQQRIVELYRMRQDAMLLRSLRLRSAAGATTGYAIVYAIPAALRAYLSRSCNHNVSASV